MDPGKEAVLRDAFNRQPAVKWSPDGVQRVMRTSFLVSGESTSRDAAFRSRFPHIQVSASNRKANHLEWMDGQKGNFFLLGRLLLERRQEYVGLVLANLDEWMHAPQTAKLPQRERLVHGIDWAAYEALAQLLGANTVAQGGEFMEFMIAHAISSAADVTSETNINVFWDDVMTAVKAGEIPLSCFRLEHDRVAHPPGRPNQKLGWKSYRLYLDPDAVVSALKIFLSRQRSEITLERKRHAGPVEQERILAAGEDQQAVRAEGGHVEHQVLGVRPGQASAGIPAVNGRGGGTFPPACGRRRGRPAQGAVVHAGARPGKA